MYGLQKIKKYLKVVTIKNTTCCCEQYYRSLFTLRSLTKRLKVKKKLVARRRFNQNILYVLLFIKNE
jgi:hypothetical protein